MIAISYRREDSLPIAGRLYDRLEVEFGKANVFMDFDSIPPGVDFRQRIKQTIEQSNVVIALIGPRWLGERSDSSRRIDDPTDFVRLEITYALQRGIPVIPLLIDNTLMPKSETLPSDIEAVAFRNALPLDTGIDFHNHADRLISGICGLVDVGRMKTQRLSGAENTRSTTAAKATALPPRSKIFVWGVVTVSVAAGVVLLVWLLAINQREEIDRSRLVLATPQRTPEVTAPPTKSVASAPQLSQAPLTLTPTVVADTPSPTAAVSQQQLQKTSIAGIWKGVVLYTTFDGRTTQAPYTITVSPDQRTITIKPEGGSVTLTATGAKRRENTLTWHYDQHLKESGKWTQEWKTESSLRLIGYAEAELTLTSTWTKGPYVGKPLRGLARMERQ